MNDQSFIQKARAEISTAQRKRAIERRNAKTEREKETAEIELFLDTCKAEGLHENNPRDLAIMIRAWCLKKGQPLQADELPDDWDPGRPFCD